MVPLTAAQQAMAERHLGLVRRIVGVVLRRWTAADREELIGAGMLGLVDATRRYDATRGASEQTFLAKRIHGAMLDYLRATQQVAGVSRIVRGDGGMMPVMVHMDLSKWLTAVETADQSLIERERRDIIRRGIGVLTGPQREAIRLRYFHELSVAEVAKVMGIGEQGVWYHLYRGLDAMREECKHYTKQSAA